MLSLPTELPSNVLMLKYEDFVEDTMIAIEKIATFFNLPENREAWATIVEQTSVSAVEKKTAGFKKFSQMDSKTQYHGNHISPYKGKTDYTDLLTPEQVKFILTSKEPIMKKGQPTGRYIGEVLTEVIARYGYTA